MNTEMEISKNQWRSTGGGVELVVFQNEFLQTSLVVQSFEILCFEYDICHSMDHRSSFSFFCNHFLYYFKITLKTVSPQRVVTIVHFTTISGHFLANPFNIFHKTEALLVILN